MSDELDVSYTDSMTVAERLALIQRMRTAWNNLPVDTKEKIKPLLDDAHKQLATFLDTGKSPSHSTQQVLRMKSYLTNDWDNHLAVMDQPLHPALLQALAMPLQTDAIVGGVNGEGEILGFRKYQKFDLRWELVAGTVWLENLLHKHPFPPGAPAIVPIDDKVTIAMLGDYGTGNFGAGDSPSVKISKFIPQLNPDYTIHLGDVYYAGTDGEEQSKLLKYWPTGSKGAFALNSNHEMYSGGGPYFNDVVGGPIFSKYQSPYSFFALENSNWIVVGLDSAYFADAAQLYLEGTLGANNEQIALLKQVAQRSKDTGKKVIVLTHHNALPVAGDDSINQQSPQKLYTQVMCTFEGFPKPAYWYYGHEHVGAAYAPLSNGLLCRCIGHGALPWGLASDLETAFADGKVQWFERCNAGDTSDPQRVFNVSVRGIHLARVLG